MSSFGRYTPRRRREEEEEREGGGLPVIPLMIIVIFAGLLLGGLLAHFIGGSESATQEPENPPPVTPIAIATPAAAPTTQRPGERRVAILQPSSTRYPSPKPRPTLTPRPTPSSSLTPSFTSTPIVIAVQPKPPRPRKPFAAHPIAYGSGAPTANVEPLNSPASATLPPAPTESPRAAAETVRERPLANTVALHVPKSPAGVVRAYLSALVHGNDTAAATYLASGSPSEQFVRGGHIEDISSVDNGDGTYQVTADVSTNDGRYYVIATVAALPYGMLITDHYHIKPH